MSIHRRDAARDANEPDIIAAFEGMKWRTYRHTIWDLTVQCPRCGAKPGVDCNQPKVVCNERYREAHPR